MNPQVLAIGGRGPSGELVVRREDACDDPAIVVRFVEGDRELDGCAMGRA